MHHSTATFVRPLLAALAALAALALAGCATGQRPAGFGGVIHNVAGEYVSTAEVGSLGRVRLALEPVEDTQTVYRAELTSEDNPELGLSRGIGTIGAEHLILNFDRGLESDYYFQGFVELSGATVTALEGTFIIPDLADPVAVRFTAQP